MHGNPAAVFSSYSFSLAGHFLQLFCSGAIQVYMIYDPDFALAHIKLSSAWFNLGKRENGVEALERAMDLIDTLSFKDRYDLLARMALVDENYDLAVEHYQNIISQYLESTAALHNMGMIYMNKAFRNFNYDKAIEYFKKALAINDLLRVTKSALRKAWALKEEGIFKKIIDQIGNDITGLF